ncbi:MAG TPA: FHA domain-containing protein, partial [Tepidiformaceae bacterium]|nr:FHA domain-containing protein [Tepidiformaceae bacterium]
QAKLLSLCAISANSLLVAAAVAHARRAKGSTPAMNAETAQAPFAYLFWVTGARRAQHAALRAEGSTIGAGGDSDVVVDDPGVSNEHLRLRREDGAWFVYDLASDSGTTVGGNTIYRHPLTDGDCIGFGETEVVFRVLGPETVGVLP